MASDSVADVRAAVVDMRRGRGWSQSELARRAGVAQGQISRFEAGLSPGVGLAWVQRLLEAMGRELVPAPRVERAVVSTKALDVDPRGLTEEELVARFPAADGFADLDFLTAALLWLRDGIVAGREPAIQGNQRTIWYRYFKPVMSGVVGRNAADGPTMVSRTMGLLVDAGRVTYSEFGLSDAHWEQRRIGTRRPGVIVYAEQIAWFRELLGLHEELGVTITCWSGQPRGITSEYTARHVLEALALRRHSGGLPRPTRTVRLIGLVDWDVAGDIIMAAFARQLERAGLRVELNFRVVRPSLFSPQEREAWATPLPLGGNRRGMAEDWLRRTGGTDGELKRLSSQHLEWERVAPIIRAVATDFPGVAHAS